MSRKNCRKTSALYTAIQSALETGDEQIILKAKKDYLRNYKSSKRRASRKVNKEVTIALSPTELPIIEQAAQHHHRSRAKYVKEACLAYANNIYLIPNEQEVRNIKQLLTKMYTILQDFTEAGALPSATTILEEFHSLELQVIDLLVNPQNLTNGD
jgi:hypothetical protein